MIKQESEKIMLFLFVFNAHRITLQLLVNQEYRTTNLGSKAKQLDLLAFTRVTTCTYAQLHKQYAFHVFLVFSVMSVHRKKSGKNKNSLRDSNLPSLHHSGQYSHITTVMIH